MVGRGGRRQRQLVGHARSIERGGLFELSEFFVLPDRQAAGIGGQLLDRAFPNGRGEVRAIIATTDTRAQARYYRAGTAARFPILSLDGAPGTATGSGPLDAALDVQPATPDDIGAMNELERSLLGFEPRSASSAGCWSKGWLSSIAAAAAWWATRSSASAGASGRWRPLSRRTCPACWTTSSGRPRTPELAEMSVDVPGPNEMAMRHCMARRFKMDPFFTIFMSSRPFGQFDRYIGFSPPFVL